MEYFCFGFCFGDPTVSCRVYLLQALKSDSGNPSFVSAEGTFHVRYRDTIIPEEKFSVTKGDIKFPKCFSFIISHFFKKKGLPLPK